MQGCLESLLCRLFGRSCPSQNRAAAAAVSSWSSGGLEVALCGRLPALPAAVAEPQTGRARRLTLKLAGAGAGLQLGERPTIPL